MIMQFLSVFFGALSVWALFYDYVQRSGETVLLTGEVWYALSPSTINLTQAIIERYIWAPLWGELILPLLEMPFWVVSAVVAFIFGGLWLVFQRRSNYY